MIYIIQAGEDGPVRIEETIDPEKWLRVQQRYHYQELRIIQQIPGGPEQKAEISSTIQEHLIRNGWYRAVTDVIDFIRELKKPEYLKIGDRAIAILYRATNDSSTELCPFCGYSHKHGTGDSFRSAHCMKGRADRYVVAKDGTKLFREHGYIIKTRHHTFFNRK